MKYKIYENPQHGLREHVKQGWSWPGFFFTFIWAFIKKMNAIGVALVGGELSLGFMVGSLKLNDDEFRAVSWVLTLVISGIVGANGNAWREKNLLSRGYVFKEHVTA